MPAGPGGHVQQPGGDVYLSVEQPGAQAVGPGCVPLPETPGALAEGSARPGGILRLLAEEGATKLLLACSLLLPAGMLELP